jgi:hypothetical protein
MDLYLIHLIFISVCAGGSYMWGRYDGVEKGHKDVLYDLLERKIVSPQTLFEHYGKEHENTGN